MYSHEDLVHNQRFMYTYDLTGRLVRQSVFNGSKKRIYDAEYGYDMNNNVCYNSGRDHIYIFYTCRRYHWDRGS